MRVNLLLTRLRSTRGEEFFLPSMLIISVGRNRKTNRINTELWAIAEGALKATFDGVIIIGPGRIGGAPNVVLTIHQRDVKFWNAENGLLARTVRAYQNRLADDEFSPDGQLVVRRGKKAALWETESGSCGQSSGLLPIERCRALT